MENQSRDIFIDPESDKSELDYFSPKHQKMKVAEKSLKQFSVSELSDFYGFYLAAYLVGNNQYTKAREILESYSTDLEELLFLKAFVYNKLQILTSYKICYDMLGPDYQRKYKLLLSKGSNMIPIVKEECEKIREDNQSPNLTLLDCKKIAWKEILLKAGATLKTVLCDYVETNNEIYMECDSFKELVLGHKSLEDCLLVLGHIIRVWLLMPNNAVSFYEQAACLNSANPAPHFFLGVTYRGKGQPEKAVEMYKKALEIKPKYPDCLFNLGNIYFEHYQDLDNAEKCYKEALASLKEEVEDDTQHSLINKGKVYNLLAEIDKQRKQESKALDLYIEGIMEDSAFIDNCTDLAEMLKTMQLEHLATAVEYMGRIIEKENQKASYEEQTMIYQCSRALETNVRRKVHDGKAEETIHKIYDLINYILLNVLLNECQTNNLKHLLLRFSFAKRSSSSAQINPSQVSPAQVSPSPVPPSQVPPSQVIPSQVPPLQAINK